MIAQILMMNKPTDNNQNDSTFDAESFAQKITDANRALREERLRILRQALEAENDPKSKNKQNPDDKDGSVEGEDVPQEDS